MVYTLTINKCNQLLCNININDYNNYINNYNDKTKFFYKVFDSKNRNKSDTLNNLLNKLTNDNINEIISKVIKYIEINNYNINTIFSKIVSITINNYTDIDKYIKLLHVINDNNQVEYKTIIQNYFDLYKNVSINRDNEYDYICEFNILKSKFIGYTILICKLEANNIINGYINIIINKLLLYLNDESNDDICNIYIHCLYEIFKINNVYISKYKPDLQQLEKKLSKKNKFIIYDIFDMC